MDNQQAYDLVAKTVGENNMVDPGTMLYEGNREAYAIVLLHGSEAKGYPSLWFNPLVQQWQLHDNSMRNPGEGESLKAFPVDQFNAALAMHLLLRGSTYERDQ